MEKDSFYKKGEIMILPQSSGYGLLLTSGYYILFESDLALQIGDIVSFDLKKAEVAGKTVDMAYNLEFIESNYFYTKQGVGQPLKKYYSREAITHKTGTVTDINPNLPYRFEHINREITIKNQPFLFYIELASADGVNLNQDDEVHFHATTVMDGYPVITEIDNIGHPLSVSSQPNLFTGESDPGKIDHVKGHVTDINPASVPTLGGYQKRGITIASSSQEVMFYIENNCIGTTDLDLKSQSGKDVYFHETTARNGVRVINKISNFLTQHPH